MPPTLSRSPTARLRLDALPELVADDAVEEGNGLDHLAVAHVQEPGIRVTVGLTVARRPGGIEKDDDRVAIGIDIAERRLQADAHAGVERPDHLAHEGLLAGIGLRGYRMTDDGPA